MTPAGRRRLARIAVAVATLAVWNGCVPAVLAAPTATMGMGVDDPQLEVPPLSSATQGAADEAAEDAAEAAAEADAMAETLREMQEDAAREAEELAAQARDVEVAREAERAARAAEEAAAREEAERRHKAVQEAERRNERAQNMHRTPSSTSPLRSPAGTQREAVGGAGRSRVPRTSLGGGDLGGGAGTGASGGSGVFSGGQGGGLSSLGSLDFEQLNAQVLEHEAASGGEERYVEDEYRKSAREELDPATRKTQHQAVARVLQAEPKDWYKVLGVRRGDDSKSIKREYRRRALDVHPDKNLDYDAPQAFEVVQEAYKVLSDPGRRKEYDRFLRRRSRAARKRLRREVWQTYESMSEFLRYWWISAKSKLPRLSLPWMLFAFIYLF